LYGFFKATVVLSSTAVEKNLRDAIGEGGRERVDAQDKAKKVGFYARLVEEAARQDVLGPRVGIGKDPVLAKYSLEIFRLRNVVAHRGVEPDRKQARELLIKAREVVEFVRTRQPGPTADEA